MTAAEFIEAFETTFREETQPENLAQHVVPALLIGAALVAARRLV